MNIKYNNIPIINHLSKKKHNFSTLRYNKTHFKSIKKKARKLAFSLKLTYIIQLK